MAQTVKNLPAVQKTLVQSLIRKTLWRREWLLSPVFLLGELDRGAQQMTIHRVAKIQTQLSDFHSHK